jgi:hypothetical protein
MNKGHRPGDVDTETLDPVVMERVGVVSGIALLPLEGAAIKDLRHGGSEAARAGLRELDDAVPAGQGVFGPARE